MTQLPPQPPPPQYPPNPYAQYQLPERPSWTVPVLAGAFATVALHSPLLIESQWWLAMCCTLGCTGVPVGFVPAILATRRDPWMGAGSGFGVAFLAVGLGAVTLAIIAFARGFHIDPEVLDKLGEQMRKDGKMSETEVTQALQTVQDASPFVPVLVAGLVSLSGGVCGAIVAALAGRRQRYPYWTPGAPPPAPPPA